MIARENPFRSVEDVSDDKISTEESAALLDATFPN
jgi:hypothetical protein